MFGYYSNWIYYVSTVLLLVNGYSAQPVRVTVTFDPPSPVRQGNVTIRCDFTLPASTTLAQQFWEILGVGRVFQYQPGNENQTRIEPDYEDKIFDYDTDNSTYLEIVFDMKACDEGQYKCSVLASDNKQNDRTEPIEVENMIIATLKNDSIEITEDTTIHLKIPVNVSCTLTDAGPPLPFTLALEQKLGNESEFSTINSDFCKNKGPCHSNETCTWTYENPVTVEVNGVNGTESITLRCRTDYQDKNSTYSPELTLIPICLGVTCDNGGTCFVDGGEAKCFCPKDIYGDFCGDISCVDNLCSRLSTCYPEDSGGLNYTCDCTGYNRYGLFCNETGCLTDEPDKGCTCENGGNCTDTLTECYCNCTEGCMGESCQLFEAGDLCPFCMNNISCSQTCDFFDCVCAYNWNGTYCNQSCILLSEDSFEPGLYNVTLGDPISLCCDSDEATSIYWVDGNENLVHNGSNLTIEVSYMANATSYLCRLGLDCTQQIEYFLNVIPPDIEANNQTTESGTVYPLTLGLDDLGPFVASIGQDSGPALSDPVITLCWLHDGKEENCSTTGTVTYFVPAPEVGAEDAGTYTAVATYLDYTQILTTVYVSFGNVAPPPCEDNGLSGGTIAGIVIGVLLGIVVIVGVVFAVKNRQTIIDKFKGNEPSDGTGQKKSRDSHEMRGEDNKIPVNDSPQKENFYSEPRKFKQQHSNKVGPDPQREINKQQRPHGGERLAPIGHSEPEQTAANEYETSPKRKKKRRRRRKAPDGQPDLSPGAEDGPRPLPVSSARPLPPIDTDRSPVHNGVQSTPL